MLSKLRFTIFGKWLGILNPAKEFSFTERRSDPYLGDSDR